MHHYCAAESAWDEADARLAKERPPVGSQQVGDFWRVSRPVYHMAMPVNADGDGPASPEEAVREEHEVWDQLCRTLCKCSIADDARLIAAAINAYSPTAAP